MKRESVNYVVVGVFVLGMLAALGALLYYLTGRQGATDEYFAHYGNVAGVKYGTPVYFDGYGIGQVDDVVPVHEKEGGVRFKVLLAVERGWPIPKDSVAIVSSSGLLSDVAIQIIEGSSPEKLKPGAEIASKDGSDLFLAINELAVEIKALTERSIRPLVDSLGTSLGQGAGPIIADMRSLLAKLNTGADNLNVLLGPENRKEVNALLRNLNETTVNAGQLTKDLSETRQALNELLAQTNGLMKDTRPELQQSARDLRVSLQTISDRIDSIVNQLDSTTRNLNEFSREIRSNPARLFAGQPPKDQVEGRQRQGDGK
jgi:phospholipid/cholesterol/gamma-HCH transport system substrate-binding protein